MAVFLAVSAAGWLSAEEVLVAEVWFDQSPILPAGVSEEASVDDTAQALLNEARYVFSGMIYGFSFVYTPSDRARQIAEVFRFEPVAEIPWSSPGLRVISTRREEYRTYGRFRYYVNRDQEARLAAWSSAALPRSAAEASASITGGRSAKYDAIESAAKEAVRAYLRTRVYNKPREIRGSLTFIDPPSTRLDAGSYVATVRVAMRIDTIRDYEHY